MRLTSETETPCSDRPGQYRSPVSTPNGMQILNGIPASSRGSSVEVLNLDEDDSLLHSRRWPGWRVVAACVVASMCVAQISISSGYASTAIPNLNSRRAPFHMDAHQQSWFISLSFVAGFFGSIVSGLVNEFFGRKLGLLIAALPSTIGWALLTGSQNIAMFYAGRFCLGLVEATCYNTASVYITEIAPRRLRGLLISLQDVSLNAGFLLSYSAGSILPWNWLAVASSVPSVILAFLVLLLPESPRWLLVHGDVEGATAALSRLYPDNAKLDVVVQEMHTAIKSTAANSLGWRALISCPLLKYLVMSQVLFITREFSGVHVLRTYTVTLFQGAGSRINPYVATIIVGAVAVSASICCLFVIDRVRRTILLPLSLTGMTIGWTVFGLCFFLQQRDPSFLHGHMAYLPLASVIGATISFGFGCSILPHVIANELFPTGARGSAHTVSLLSSSVFAFISSKCYVNIQQWMGDFAAFWMFGAVCFAGALFTFFLFPETKDKPLEALQD